MSKIDNQNKALNDEAGKETSPDTTPVAEEKTPEEVKPAVEASTPGIAETEGEPKKGAEARIRELNQKAKSAEDKAKSLEQKLAELTNPVGFQGTNVPQYNPQEPIVAPGEEIDVNELNKRQSEREVKMLQQAAATAQLMQKQSEAINRINSEASEVVGKYAELNPESDSFNRELSDTVTEATEAYIKANPYTASVKGFVSRLMNSLQGAVAKEAGQVTEKVAKQVSEAALRPTSIKQEEKKASEKSIAELEAELGVVNS